MIWFCCDGFDGRSKNPNANKLIVWKDNLKKFGWFSNFCCYLCSYLVDGFVNCYRFVWLIFFPLCNNIKMETCGWRWWMINIVWSGKLVSIMKKQCENEQKIIMDEMKTMTIENTNWSRPIFRRLNPNSNTQTHVDNCFYVDPTREMPWNKINDSIP